MAFFTMGRMVCTEGINIKQRATLYEPDFVIFNADGTYRVIDTKGMQTNVFKLKVKMLKEKYPHIQIELE